MKKTILKITSLVLILVLSLAPIKASAADKEYQSFSQVDPRWASHVYGGGRTIGQAGCLITAVSVLMAYANPDLRDVNSFNPQVASSKFGFQGAAFVWGSCANADPSFNFVSKVHSGGALGEERARSIVKEQLDAGNYVVLCTVGMYTRGGTHYSPVVGWDGSKPLVWDVAGGKNSSWEAWSGNGITEICVFSSSKNKSLDVLGKDNGATAEEPKTEEEKAEIDKLIKEWDLRGMPSDFSFAVSQSNLELPEKDSLTNVEKSKIEKIDESKQIKDKSYVDTLKICVTFLGLLLVLYGILLILAYMLDYSNVFIEISFLKVISLGKFRLLEESEEKEQGYDRKRGVTYLTKSMVVRHSAVIIAVGLFLISGLMFSLIIGVVGFVQRTVGFEL